MAFVLTPLYTEDFTTDSAQNPLSVTNWVGDNSGNFDAGDNLQVLANSPPPGPTGKTCMTSVSSPEGIGFGYWTGNAPSNAYISVKLGYISDVGGISLLYGCNTPQQFLSGSFYLQINGPTTTPGAGEIQLVQEPGGVIQFDLTGLTLLPNDIITVVYVGRSHYALQNGVLLPGGDFDASVDTAAGVKTAGLSTQVQVQTDAMIQNVTIGTASETGGGSNSSWLSVAANNILRGSRSH